MKGVMIPARPLQKSKQLIRGLSLSFAQGRDLQEYQNNAQRHEEYFRVGDQSEDVALLELNERNHQACSPPAILAQHLVETGK